MKNKIAIVVPAHIPLTKDWINALEREARIGNADVIIVDDSDGKLGELPSEWTVMNYFVQEKLLGELYEDFAKMFHKSSSCRIVGHILAYKHGAEIIIGLDSDCVVPTHFVEDHLTMLNLKRGYGWANPLSSSELYPRGFPYSMRNWQIVANMGMWDNVLDLNGKDRFAGEPTRVNAPGYSVASAPIPFSGMNFAITREVMFGFLFLPNFNFTKVNQPAINGLLTEAKRWEFRRIDDIWGGYIFQKLLQKLHLAVTYGKPIVYHDTVVIAAEDAAEEEAMYEFEDNFVILIEKELNAIPRIVGEIEMNDLMSVFCEKIVYESSFSNGKGIFFNLVRAFEWWSKVIKKYGK